MLKKVTAFVIAMIYFTVLPAFVADAGEGTDETISLTLPISLSFVIDPFELEERGQIYSDEYVIENHGTTGVFFAITDVKIYFANDTDFVPLVSPFDVYTESSLKEIYLELDFNRADIPSFILTDLSSTETSGFVIDSSEDGLSSVILTITGNVNPNPLNPWAAGDVVISIAYKLGPVGSDNEQYDDMTDKDESDGNTLPELPDDIDDNDNPDDLDADDLGADELDDDDLDADEPEDAIKPEDPETDTDLESESGFEDD